MQVRACGCHGGETASASLSGYLIDGTVALDAGSLTRALDLDEQEQITDVLLTHSHLDHVRDLAFLADNRAEAQGKPIQIWGLPPVLQSIRDPLFNDILWPDFSRIPNLESPIIRYCEVEAEQPFRVAGYEGVAVSTHHPVPSSAFLLQDERSTVCFSGDTGPTDRLWQVLNERENLRALFLEVSFPDEMQEMADVSGHLTPRDLKQQLALLEGRDFPVYLVHLKPRFTGPIREQVMASRLAAVSFLEDGQVLEL